MIKIQRLFVLAFLVLPGYLNAQETRFIFFESGIDFISCQPPEKEYIRGNIEPQYYAFTNHALRGLYYKNYFSLKAEKRLMHDMIGLSTGIRFTRSEASIGKNSYWSSPSEYFYFRLKEDGTNTEYLRVKELSQISRYIGIPLEIRVYPYKPHFFNVYYKLGADFNILVSQKTDAELYTPAVITDRNEMAQIIENPWSVFSSLHLGVGFKLGKPGKTSVMWEVCVPTVLITPKNGLLSPQAGGGFQLNVRIPF